MALYGSEASLTRGGPETALLGSSSRAPINQTQTKDRVKSLATAHPWLVDQPDALMALAQLPEDERSVHERAKSMFTSTVSAQFVDSFNQYDEARRLALWSQMDTRQQRLMERDGAQVPELDPDESESLLHKVAGGLADVAGPVLGFGHSIISETVGPVLHDLQILQDTAQHAYRASQQLEEEEKSYDFGNLLWMATHPTKVAEAWMETGVGERVFTRESKDKANEILLDDDDLLALAEELSLGSVEEVATDLAGVDGGPYGDRRGYAIDHLAKRVGTPGSKEYKDVYKQIDDALEDPLMKQAIAVLDEGHVSIGRDVERLFGVAGRPGRGWLSGTIDFGVAVLLDPTLIAGKAYKANLLAKRGFSAADKTGVVARVRELAEAPSVKRYADEIAEKLNGDVVSQFKLRRENPGIEKLIQPMTEYMEKELPGKVRTTLLADGRTSGYVYNLTGKDITDYYSTSAGIAALTSGGTHTAAHGVAMLPRITAVGVRRKMLSGGFRDVIDFASAKPVKFGDFAPGELTNAERFGAFLGSTPVIRQLQLPASSLLKAVTTQAPQFRDALLSGASVGAGRLSDRELRLQGEMVATLSGMNPKVKQFFLGTMLAGDTPAARRAGIKSFLAESLALAGFDDANASTAMREFADRVAGIQGKLYSIGGNDLKSIGGMDNIHEGMWLQADRADAIALPNQRELALATRKGNMIRTIWGTANTPMWDALMGRVWKPSVLLRIGFIPRAAGDELLSYLMRDYKGFLRGLVLQTTTNDIVYEAAKAEGEQFGGFYLGKAGRIVLGHIEQPDEAWRYNQPIYNMLHKLTFGGVEGERDPWTAFLSARILDAERHTRAAVGKVGKITGLVTQGDLDLMREIASDPQWQKAWANAVSTSEAGMLAKGAGVIQVPALNAMGDIEMLSLKRTKNNRYVIHSLQDATDPAAAFFEWSMRTRLTKDSAARARLKPLSAYMSPMNRHHIEQHWSGAAEETLTNLARLSDPKYITDDNLLRIIHDGDVEGFIEWDAAQLEKAATLRSEGDHATAELVEREHDAVASEIAKVVRLPDKNTRSFVLGRMVDGGFDAEVRSGAKPLTLYTDKDEVLRVSDEAGHAMLGSDESFADWNANDWSVNGPGGKRVLSAKTARSIFDDNAKAGAPAVLIDDFEAAYGKLADDLNMVTEKTSMRALADNQHKEIQDLFFNGDGDEVLHRVLTSMLLDKNGRQFSGLQDIHDVSNWITKGIQGPEYAIAMPRRLEDGIRWGFDKVIGPSIDSIVRQPMFMDNALKAMREGAGVRELVLGDEFAKIGSNLFANHADAFKFLDDMTAKNGVEFEERWLRSKTALIKVQDELATHLGHAPTAEEYTALRQIANMRRNLGNIDRDVAIERAIADCVPYIDDHHIRSQFQEWATNFVPFWFAEETFLKRWARTARFSPEGFQKAQLIYMGMRHAGVIRKNEHGEDVFVYPGNNVMAAMLAAPVRWVTGADLTSPIANSLTGEVKFSLPGLDNAGVPSFGPMVTVPTGFLTDAYPEFRGLKTAIQGERAREGNPLLQLVPTSVSRFIQAAQPESYLSAQFAVMDYMAANDMQPPDNASPHEVQVYLERVKQWTRGMVIMRGIYGFLGPASPAIEVAQQSKLSAKDKTAPRFLREEWNTMLQNYPSYEEAFGAFMKRFPDGSAFTVFPSDKPSGAQPASTNETVASIDGHREFYDAFKMAGPWFMPQRGDNDQYSAQAHKEQAALEVRIKKSPLEYYNALHFQAASEAYFQTVEDAKAAIEQAGTYERQEIRQWLSGWKESYFLRHPIFRQELEANRSRDQRRAVLDEMKLAFDDPKGPSHAHVRYLRDMVESLEDFLEEKRDLGSSTRASVKLARDSLQVEFDNWGQRFVNKHPELSSFWKAIVAPEAGINAYDDAEDEEYGAA